MTYPQLIDTYLACGSGRQGVAIDATMRAACITEPGPPEAIQVGELPVPVPGSTVVLVAVEVSAVKAADTFIRSGPSTFAAVQ